MLILETPAVRSTKITETSAILNPSLHGYTRCSYDIDRNLVTNACVGLTKKFHCWYVAAECGTGQSWHRHRDGEYSQKLKSYFGFSVGLTAMPGLSFGQRVRVGGD